MKKLLGLLLLCISLLTSCSKSSKKDNALSEDQGKQSLEDNSIAVLNKFEEFRNDSALQEIEEFLEFLTTEENTKNKEILKKVKNTLYISTQVKQNKISTVNYPSTLFAAISAPSQTELEKEFNESVGTHTWNSNSDDFDFSESNDGKINFSVTQNNKTAVLTISNFSAYEHASGEEAPKSIKVELKVNNNKIMGIDYSATIADNEYIPTKVSSSLSLGVLSYNAVVTNNNTDGSVNQSLNIGNTKVLGLDLSGKGNYAEINNSGESNKTIDLLLNSANATLYVGEISLSVDAKISDKLNEEIKTVENEVSILNETFDITIKSGKNKIADGEFYIGTYSQMEYYYTGNGYVSEEVEYETPDVRLVFKDGSKSTLEAYFEFGFEDMMDTADNTLNAYSE
ncbi:hypothetical protein FHR24_000311 [Wenyingzhuangia heitensis]|uniref:Lipoprotein n=1 Tax=Wenyingzhuangia heitensis TaxID=1487859 RepID=A0ABX0U4Z4_9FLAO|nr:hypothetical protein [Wenyingzhuangia heitensis]NIJ43872.1 hypothetical protein [Wenyingzhuangia heitensis]